MSVNINGNIFDPNPAAPAPQGVAPDSAVQPASTVPASQVDLTGDAAKANYVVIVANGPLTRQQKATLSNHKVKIIEYIDNHSYMCEYRPTDLNILRAESFVKFAFVVPDAAAIQPKLNAWMADSSDSAGTQTVDVVVHRHGEKAFDEVVDQVARITGRPREEFDLSDHKIRLQVNRDQLATIAALDHVKSVDLAVPVVLHNDVARTILGAADVKINNTDYDGKGQFITVADTGLDKGSADGVHPAFTGRVHKLIPIGRPAATNDFNGHGTHVAGSVLGDANSNALGINRRVQGTAPAAKLILQSLLTDAGGLWGAGNPKTIFDILEEAYKLDPNMRVHTNSWGIPWRDQDNNILGQQPYNNASWEVDQAIWTHNDLVVLFSAGNSGRENPDADSKGHVGGQAASKNCITVGASVTSRPSDFKASVDSGGVSKAPPEDASKIAVFSSRGPTAERRAKPDVVSPGTAILSAKSRDKPPARRDDDNAIRAEKAQNSGDPAWIFLQGTSMATPLVAGCCAVLRQALIDGGTPRPTASLIKALLINGATNLGKSQAEQGWGRVNLTNSIPSKNATLSQNSSLQFLEGELADEDGKDAKHTTIMLPTGVRELKATLVYNDPPGLVLQNDLTLIVTAENRTAKFGNVDNERRVDLVPNNVEQVVWPNPPAGKMVLTVTATRFTKDRQPFALVWRVTPLAK
jgi:serine protease AprX